MRLTGRTPVVAPCGPAHWRCRPGTPAAIVAQLSRAVHDIALQPATKERFLAAGARLVSSTPQETAAFVVSERVKWKEVVRLSGARLD